MKKSFTDPANGNLSRAVSLVPEKKKICIRAELCFYCLITNLQMQQADGSNFVTLSLDR